MRTLQWTVGAALALVASIAVAQYWGDDTANKARTAADKAAFQHALGIEVTDASQVGQLAGQTEYEAQATTFGLSKNTGLNAGTIALTDTSGHAAAANSLSALVGDGGTSTGGVYNSSTLCTSTWGGTYTALRFFRGSGTLNPSKGDGSGNLTGISFTITDTQADVYTKILTGLTSYVTQAAITAAGGTVNIEVSSLVCYPHSYATAQALGTQSIVGSSGGTGAVGTGTGIAQFATQIINYLTLHMLPFAMAIAFIGLVLFWIWAYVAMTKGKTRGAYYKESRDYRGKKYGTTARKRQ